MLLKKSDVITKEFIYFLGPAERLFSEDYYKLVHAALKDDGILSVQGDNIRYLIAC